MMKELQDSIVASTSVILGQSAKTQPYLLMFYTANKCAFSVYAAVHQVWDHTLLW